MDANQHRTRLYGRYVSEFKRDEASRNESAYREWSRACAWRVRGWLPKNKNAHILDVACGSGNFLHTMASLGYSNIEGVDHADQQIQIARRRFAGVHLRDAIEFLREHPAEYDFISAFDFIEHLTRIEAITFMDAACNALNGGALLLQLPNCAAPAGMAVWGGDLTHEQIYSPDALSQLVQVCGFDTPEFRESGPVPFSALGVCRMGLWQVLKAAYKMSDLIETGTNRIIYSRVMLALARKRGSI
jgi:2-polyprenyl-3-methyl-5-hydroxy-6-metoxy-1,4-benzoquinol methylase